MKTIMQLLTHKGIFLLVLIIPFGLMQEFGVDTRIAMLWAGLVFLGSGIGQLYNAEEVSKRKKLAKGLGWFFIVLAIFVLFMGIFMLATGQEMQTS